jgi:hypothetical protein
MIDDPVATYLGNSQGSPKWLMNPKVLVESITPHSTIEAGRKGPMPLPPRCAVRKTPPEGLAPGVIPDRWLSVSNQNVEGFFRPD